MGLLTDLRVRLKQRKETSLDEPSKEIISTSTEISEVEFIEAPASFVKSMGPFPPELLIQIFFDYLNNVVDVHVDSSPDLPPWLTIALVCRTWQSLLLSTPECFSSLVLKLDIYDPRFHAESDLFYQSNIAERNAKLVVNRFITHLRHTGDRPVRLTIIDFPTIDVEASDVTSMLCCQLEQYLPTLESYSEVQTNSSIGISRGWFSRVVFGHSVRMGLSLEPFKPLTHLRISRQSFELTPGIPPEIWHVPLDLPCLRLLYLDFYKYPLGVLESFNAPVLEDLTLLYDKGTLRYPQLKEALRKFHNLQALTLNASFEDFWYMVLHPSEYSPVIHPQLHTAFICEITGKKFHNSGGEYIYPDVKCLTLHNVISPDHIYNMPSLPAVETLRIEESRESVDFRIPSFRGARWTHKLENLRFLSFGRPVMLSSMLRDAEWEVPIFENLCPPPQSTVEELLDCLVPKPDDQELRCRHLKEVQFCGMSLDNKFLTRLHDWFTKRKEFSAKVNLKSEEIVPDVVCRLRFTKCAYFRYGNYASEPSLVHDTTISSDEVDKFMLSVAGLGNMSFAL